ADEVRVARLVARERAEEFARARARDRADVRHHLLARHADAVVGDADRARRRVHRDADAQVRIRLVQRVVRERLEAQLVGRIRGVRDELAQEDLLVAVQGVHHQLEQLPHLGLEAERFLRRRRHRLSNSPDVFDPDIPCAARFLGAVRMGGPPARGPFPLNLRRAARPHFARTHAGRRAAHDASCRRAAGPAEIGRRRERRPDARAPSCRSRPRPQAGLSEGSQPLTSSRRARRGRAPMRASAGQNPRSTAESHSRCGQCRSHARHTTGDTMTRNLKLTTLAAALATAALAATPAWAQATTGTTGASNGGAASSTLDDTTNGSASGAAGSSQFDTANTHLNANCIDPVTGLRRNTADCVGFSGAGSANAGTAGAGTSGSIAGSTTAPATGSMGSGLGTTGPTTTAPATGGSAGVLGGTAPSSSVTGNGSPGTSGSTIGSGTAATGSSSLNSSSTIGGASGLGGTGTAS